MEEWKTYKLSEIGNIVGGATPSTKIAENYDGDIPWITPKDLSDFSGRFIKHGERNITQHGFDSCSCQMLPKNSVLFSSRAPIGYVAIAAAPLCTNQGFKSVVPNEEIVDPRFLYYLLKFNKDRIAGMGSGTTFMEVSGRVMKNVEVSLPVIAIQKHIAEILSSIDDKIELNNRINHNLEEQAQALYKSWFVDFEPFKDGKFVESELGMIPEGWRVGNLGELLDIRYGKDHKNLSDGPYPVYGSGGFMRKVERPLFEGESVLIPRKGSLNNVMYVNEAFWSVDTMFYSVEKMPNVAKYCYQILSQKDLASMNSGSAVPSMSTDILNTIQVIIPDKKVLEYYNIILSRVFSSCASIRNESFCLVDIRNSILPKLMNGEILC